MKRKNEKNLPDKIEALSEQLWQLRQELSRLEIPADDYRVSARWSNAIANLAAVSNDLGAVAEALRSRK